ncbi:MAG: hypothetical protein J4215_03370 [Candidatus Diapherotrites archaeon]|uniref:Uncharacterized protein n=1 Tax=Candidatus Iainarchaeum sp. TaxID=3101447 RepID=A0A8T4LFC7_9ARCH|nr:hypothetical protein [Candidatus Diapherotrites archaeon]
MAKEAKSNGVAVQTAENAAESEEVGQTVESVEASPEELPEDKLPFPRATVVNQMRKYLDSGKQIKGQVKDEMNIWLGKMIERTTSKMNEHPYSYVDGGMFREAIETYENVLDIENERKRIILQLEAVKAACDVLINEVDRKFRK